MEKLEVQVAALSSSETSPGNYALVLEAVETQKKMAIIIGAPEAQSIALHMERMQLPRPLTHDLFRSALLALNCPLKEVLIHNIIDGIFYAVLVIKAADGNEITVDARASDALALAVRFDCPVYVYEFVFKEACLDEVKPAASFLKGSLAEYTLEELESLLQDVLAKEDYESAGRIRDMINKRKGLSF